MQRPWVLVALLATGCTWLGRGQLDERLEELDEDKDGISIAGGDCAPLDPDRSPDLEEVPYDRIDNDCDDLGLDVVDVDQDGYPGISQADYEALPGDVPYPDAFVGKDVDCDDTNKLVYPDPDGSIEVYYDGVDGDCQRDNDFDADGDGYHPDRVEGVQGDIADLVADYVAANGLDAEAQGWGPGGSGPALPHDCDDAQDAVNPGVTTDGWYDGVDDNCDDLNDFDQDGDGFMPPEWAEEYEFYVTRYYGEDPPPFPVDADPFRDCADAPFGPLTTLAEAAAVHPGAPETPYDGIDSDCAGDNDYDVDQDGWMPDDVASPQTTLEAMQDYAATWDLQANVVSWAMGNGTEPGEGDCDDREPATHPGALEVLDDPEDFDCNGDPDLADWGFDGDATAFSWIRPTNPELVRLGDEYLLLVTAEQVNLSGFNSADQGTTLRFPLAGALGGAPPMFPYTTGTWKGGGQILKVKRRLDIARAPTDRDLSVPPDGIVDPEVFTLVPSFGSSNYSYLYVGAVHTESTNGGLGTRNTYAQYDGLVPALYTYVAGGVDLVVDTNGDPFAAACGTENGVGAPADVVHALWSPSFPALDGYVEIGGDTCFFNEAPRQVLGNMTTSLRVCPAGADCTDVAIEEGPGFTDLGGAGERWTYGDNDEGWIALLDGSRRAFVRDSTGAYPTFPVLVGGALPTSVVKDPTGIGSTIDVAVDGTDVYVAAILQNDEVWLQYGSPQNPRFLDLELTPPAGTGTPTGVAVFADADRVAVAVSTTSGSGQGSVGWMFLGPP